MLWGPYGGGTQHKLVDYLLVLLKIAYFFDVGNDVITFTRSILTGNFDLYVCLYGTWAVNSSLVEATKCFITKRIQLFVTTNY